VLRSGFELLDCQTVSTLQLLSFLEHRKIREVLGRVPGLTAVMLFEL